MQVLGQQCDASPNCAQYRPCAHAMPLPLLPQDLFNNQLTNTLPNQWSVLTGLDTLRLDKNQFTVWTPHRRAVAVSPAGTVRRPNVDTCATCSTVDRLDDMAATRACPTPFHSGDCAAGLGGLQLWRAADAPAHSVPPGERPDGPHTAVDTAPHHRAEEAAGAATAPCRGRLGPLLWASLLIKRSA